MTLDVGGSKSLTATVLPVGASQDVLWQTLDQRVATVDSVGLVKAVGAGTVDIVGTTTNGLSAVCKVTVREAETQ